MGIAITSGVLASLHSQSPLHGLNSGQPKWESHTPGTSTPTVAAGDDPTLPSRFIACVQREESARRLRETFRAVLGGGAVEITVGENVSAVQGAARMALQLDAHPAQIKRHRIIMTHTPKCISAHVRW